MDPSETQQHLLAAYQAILSRPEFHLSDTEAVGLSGLFLPQVTAAYCTSSVRLMLVGQETKSWNGALHNYRAGDDFDAYMVLPLTAYRQLTTSSPGKHRFLQFHRSIGKRLGRPSEAVIWGNLFASSYHKASPLGSKTFGTLRNLSRALLRAQVDILKPHGILFTTGWRYDVHLKHCFGEDLHDSHVCEPKALWRFKLGSTLCYRTSHPRYAAHNPQRELALKALTAYQGD